MDVKKWLIIATAVLVFVMFFDGIFMKDAPLMILASTAISYAFMRIVVIAVLVALLLTSPPRSTHFRGILGGLAAVLFAAAMLLSVTYRIEVLDAVIFMEVAIICMIEALETRPVQIRKLGYNFALAKR